MKRLAVLLLGLILSVAAALYYFLPRIEFPPPVAESKTPVSIALSMQPTSLLAFVALDQGYFARYGLDVAIQRYPSGRRAMDEALFTGQAEFAWANEVPIVFTAFRREDLRVIAATLTADDVNKIIASKNRGITRPEDLRGKRIGTQKASAVHFFLHLFLLDHGMSEKDVQPVFLKAEEMPTALASGAIDAYSMRDPYITQGSELLGEQAVVFESPGVYEQIDVVVTRDDVLKEKPAVARKILQAMVDAERFARSKPRESAEILRKNLGVDIRQTQTLLENFKIRVSLAQSLLILLESQARWAVKSGLVEAQPIPDFLRLIDAAPLRQIKPESVTLIQ